MTLTLHTASGSLALGAPPTTGPMCEMCGHARAQVTGSTTRATVDACADCAALALATVLDAIHVHDTFGSHA